MDITIVFLLTSGVLNKSFIPNLVSSDLSFFVSSSPILNNSEERMTYKIINVIQKNLVIEHLLRIFRKMKGKIVYTLFFLDAFSKTSLASSNLLVAISHLGDSGVIK